MTKLTKKRLLIGGTLAILMLPVILMGIVGRFVYNYLETGAIIYEIWEESLEKWLDK